MGLLSTTGHYTTSIKGYGDISITYRLPSAIEADRIFTESGDKWNKESLFRALVTEIEVEKAPEIKTVDDFLNAPNTIKAFWGVVQDMISAMWMDESSKN